MSKKKSVFISIVIVLLVIVVVTAVTYAYFASITNEEQVGTGSGMLGINYVKPGDLTGTLMLSTDRGGGLKTTATASLTEDSEGALFNMYITPTQLTNLNIPALKWEVEGVREGNVVCYGNGDFGSAEVGTSIKILNGCSLSTTATTFTIYIWLDSSLVNSAVGGASFDAKIGADSVPITGGF